MDRLVRVARWVSAALAVSACGPGGGIDTTQSELSQGSAVSFTATPNPVAPGQTVVFTGPAMLSVSATNARATLWFYNSAGGYVGSASESGLTFVSSKPTPLKISYATPSTLAHGTYTYNLSFYDSSGKGIAGQTHDGSFAVGTSSGGSHTIKWHPGHYMASGGVLGPGQTIANSQFLPYELEALNNKDAILGYRLLITWAALEPTEGKYDFSQITEVLTYLKTKLNVPKRLVLVVLPGNFNSAVAGGSTLPQYLLNGSAYGRSPVAGSYGWWGGTGNGRTSTACLYRPAVMARWIALHQALGAAFDSEPNFEALMFQEDSWVMGAWTTNHPPDYPGDSAMLTGFESLLTATLTAFPHTNVIFQNTWMGTPPLTAELEQFMVKNRVAPSTADTFGQTWITAHGRMNSWGMDAYVGITEPGYSYSTSDLRPQMPSMVDIEGPDLGVYQNMGGTNGAGGYLPQDICHALNQSYKASHAFWTWLTSSEISVPSQTWPELSATVSACPLVHTGYPAAYPR
jgi:hypothetical protein